MLELSIAVSFKDVCSEAHADEARHHHKKNFNVNCHLNLHCWFTYIIIIHKPSNVNYEMKNVAPENIENSMITYFSTLADHLYFA